MKFLFIICVLCSALNSWAQDGQTLDLAQKLAATPVLGDCRISGVTVYKQKIHMTLSNSDSLIDLQIPVSRIVNKGTKTTAKFIQKELLGAQSLPFVVENKISMRIQENENGEITSLKLKSVDYSIILIPAGIQRFNCQK